MQREITNATSDAIWAVGIITSGILAAMEVFAGGATAGDTAGSCRTAGRRGGDATRFPDGGEQYAAECWP